MFKLKHISCPLRNLLWAIPGAVWLAGCASASLRETTSQTATPVMGANPVVVSWVASTKCHALAFGCSLGGQQGGLDAQRAHLTSLLAEGESLFFWTGDTFLCDAGPSLNASLYTAKAAKELPLRFIAPAAGDLGMKPVHLKQFQIASAKPWIVSNLVKSRSDVALEPFLDLNVGAGQFRIFNFVWPTQSMAKISKGYRGDIAALEKLLAATPAGRVNVVILNSPNVLWVSKFQRVRNAHLIVDGMATTGEMDGLRFLPGDRVFASVRQLGQAAFVIRLQTESAFKGFFNESVAVNTRNQLAVGLSPSVVEMSPQKAKGLWNADGGVALLNAPD